MNINSKSIVLVAALSSALIPLFASTSANEGSGRQTPPARLYRPYGKKASEVYKNIQVLKDIDSTELIPTMYFMADSLNVGCEFCHVAGGSDKDDKASKREARKMILMTRDINKNHFNGNTVVSCPVCHRGAEMPVFSPAIAVGETPTVAANPTPSNLPTADQILDKYLQAVGGAAAIQKLSTRVDKGTLISGDQELPYEIYMKAPDKRVAISHGSEGDFMTKFDGSSGWIEVTSPEPPGRDLTPSETASVRLDAQLRFALDSRRILHDLLVLPPEKIDGKEMYVLSGQPEGMRPVKFYFDEKTGLLMRTLRNTQLSLGITPVQFDYADYRDVAGVKVPFRTTQVRPRSRSIVQLDSVQLNVSMDDSKFARSPMPKGTGQ